MGEHYCGIHQTDFFRTAKMRGYAHPIGEKDEGTGKYPEGWCNEEDLEKVKNLPPQSSQVLRPEDQKIIDEEVAGKPAPQEIGMWYKELGEMIRAKDIDITRDAGRLMRTAYYAKMMSVLDIKIEDK